MEKLKNIHPGEVLLEEFLKPLKVSAYRLSKETLIPQTRVSEIIKGRRRITADTALRFSKFFGNSTRF
ncbi:MAG: HigA family addiction module antidote protein [Flavobacteriales bacterium]|nr:HigA family addiction module antidote protein [Flavobacteriales bacterium]